jgi:hypothetical protein
MGSFRPAGGGDTAKILRKARWVFNEFLQIQTGPFFNQAAAVHHECELPHDDFRRAHHDHRSAHYDWRGSDYDFRMTFISPVPVPSAFGNKTSSGGEEGDNADK